MMTWAWTYGWTLLNQDRKVASSAYTKAYLMLLVNNLTPAQQLYAEISWADPIVNVQ